MPILFQFLLHIKPTITPEDVATSSQSLPNVLTVMSANIEGISAVKASVLSDVCKEQHWHCLCLQETQRGARKARLRIPGMTIVAERPHDNYGSVIFIIDDLKVRALLLLQSTMLKWLQPSYPMLSYCL